MKFYDRIYYTFYRLLLKLSDMYSMIRETPREETVLILIILTSINAISLFGFLDLWIEMPVIPEGKSFGMLLFLPIVILNFLAIFNKKRFNKIEAKLSPVWKEQKGKNILLTITYIGLTIALFIFSALFSKNYIRN